MIFVATYASLFGYRVCYVVENVTEVWPKGEFAPIVNVADFDRLWVSSVRPGSDRDGASGGTAPESAIFHLQDHSGEQARGTRNKHPEASFPIHAHVDLAERATVREDAG